MRFKCRRNLLSSITLYLLSCQSIAQRAYRWVLSVTHSFDLEKVRFYLTASQEVSRYIGAAVFRAALSGIFDIVHLHVEH